ncbi:MAG: GAF domain-containing protein [Anaerolineales bacterium]|nr:GAF domain-containing protein [Anaerolineales bacterium]
MSRNGIWERANENKILLSVMDSLLDEVIFVDLSGEILWVNQAWRDFAQENNANEVTCLGVGMNYFEVCRKAREAGDSLAGEVLAGLLELSAGKRAECVAEYPCQTPQADLWFRMRAVRFPGKNSPLIIIHHNISERIHAEKAFRNESDRFYSVVNSMADIVFVLDREGRHTGVYGQWIERYGVNEAMFIGKTAREILGDNAAKVHEEANMRALTGENVIYEWSYRDQNGEHIIQTHLSPLRDITGQIQGIVGVGRDLTERVKLERLIEDQTDQRLRELEAINHLSKTMRTANTSVEIVEALLWEAAQLFESSAGSVWLYDPSTHELVPQAVMGWFREVQQEPLQPGEGLVGRVFEQGLQLWSDEFVSDERASVGFRQQARPGWGGVVLPIVAKEEVLGAIVLAFPTDQPLRDDELKILTAFCELAGSALQRAKVTEQIERRIQQLLSLRTIDNAINSSLDLNLTLNILLEQVLAHVHSDAADILLFDTNSYTMKVAAHRGYRSLMVKPLTIAIGNGMLTRVLNERQITMITDLTDIELECERQSLFRNEGFRSYLAIPLLAKGQIVGVLEVFLRTPRFVTPDELEFLETLAGQAAIAIDNASLFHNLQQTNTQLTLAYDSTLEGWARALELRDNETEGHSRRVTDLTLRLAQALGVPESEWVHIRRGAILHDIGKMGIPDEILHKSGPLDEHEWQIMKQHPVFAYHLLQPIRFLEKAAVIPYCHHERWDGSGYPQGLQGEQIPFAARIFAVVDVFDALCSDRPYRSAWSKTDALQFLREQAGKLFDERVVKAFLDLVT